MTMRSPRSSAIGGTAPSSYSGYAPASSSSVAQLDVRSDQPAHLVQIDPVGGTHRRAHESVGRRKDDRLRDLATVDAECRGLSARGLAAPVRNDLVRDVSLAKVVFEGLRCRMESHDRPLLVAGGTAVAGSSDRASSTARQGSSVVPAHNLRKSRVATWGSRLVHPRALPTCPGRALGHVSARRSHLDAGLRCEFRRRRGAAPCHPWDVQTIPSVWRQRPGRFGGRTSGSRGQSIRSAATSSGCRSSVSARSADASRSRG